MTPTILITIDVEDWFQVENFKPWIPFSSWPSCELRVEQNTHRLLDLFDSVELNNKQQTTDNARTNKLRATFFVLGWLAERLPGLVREIQARGHEVASHGYNHGLGNRQSLEDLKTDLIDSKKLLEDIIGEPVYGYRAPSFSVNDDILKVIEDCGYRYDSSYNSFGMHGRYGKLSVDAYSKKGIAFQISEHFYELPISNLYLLRRKTHNRAGGSHLTGTATSNLQPTTHNPRHSNTNPQPTTNNRRKLILPWGGGGYFRMIPFAAFKQGVKRIIKKENTYLFYAHPWEVDPNQPRVESASAPFKFRHYIHLAETYKKMNRFIFHFNHCRFFTCSEYLSDADTQSI